MHNNVVFWLGAQAKMIISLSTESQLLRALYSLPQKDFEDTLVFVSYHDAMNEIKENSYTKNGKT